MYRGRCRTLHPDSDALARFRSSWDSRMTKLIPGHCDWRRYAQPIPEIPAPTIKTSKGSGFLRPASVGVALSAMSFDLFQLHPIAAGLAHMLPGSGLSDKSRRVTPPLRSISRRLLTYPRLSDLLSGPRVNAKLGKMLMGRLSRKIAIITGGSSGTGRGNRASSTAKLPRSTVGFWAVDYGRAAANRLRAAPGAGG